MGEVVPIGDAHRLRIEERHDVVVGEKDAVERPRGRDQFIAVRREDHSANELVDRRIGDAGIVSRPLLVDRG
ncbi:hypothetical protein D9M72_569270 [compost metagenome]